MENGERGEPRGIVKTERRIWAVTSAQQRPLWRIFSAHSPSMRPGLTVVSRTTVLQSPASVAPPYTKIKAQEQASASF